MRRFFTKRKLRKIENDPNTNVIVSNFHGVNWREKLTLPIFVVYRGPTDFPANYVVRLFDGKKPLRLVAVKNTLDEARAAIQQGPPFVFSMIPRFENDDPKIVETWL